MPKFHLEIAGQVAAVTALFDSTPFYLEEFLTEKPADFSFVISTMDLELERRMRHAEALAEGLKPRPDQAPLLERLSILRKFSRLSIDRGILPVHGSAVAVDGLGYLFTAPCGTGKSTHTRLWREFLGERAVMINDDKPFIRLYSDGAILCGSPWSGKHGLGTNMEVPLGGICLLERGVENVISHVSPAEAGPFVDSLQPYLEADLIPVYRQRIVPLMESVPLWHLRCNMDLQAARVSYEAMSGSV